MSKLIDRAEKYNKERYIFPEKSGKNTIKRLEAVLKQVPHKGYVLDVACGNGRLMTRMEKKGLKTFGVDISDKALKSAKKKGLDVKNLNLEHEWSKEYKEKFDVVTASEIIEHIYDTDAFLKNINRSLKRGGILVISTPNVANLGRRLMLLIGKNPLLETTLRNTDSGHIRYFTIKDLKKLVEEHGFKVLKVTSTTINFDNMGIISSSLLAKIFPTLGSTIILKAKKVKKD